MLLAGAMGAAGQGPSERPQAILFDTIVGDRGRIVKAAVRSERPVPAAVSSATRTESRAFDLMNAQRRASGLSELQWSERLVDLARRHSESMAADKYFSHRDPTGGYVDDRASKLGIFNWLAIGENIAFMRGFQDPALMAVEKWMESPSHKKNILNAQWRETAIGAATASDGSTYFTQVFVY